MGANSAVTFANDGTKERYGADRWIWIEHNIFIDN
jgi:hypothetical protein